MLKTIDRPEVMDRDDAGQRQEKYANVSSSSDGTEVWDFQWKPNSEELVSGHNDKYPDVGIAENIDKKVQNAAGKSMISDERWKVNEILREKN